MFKVEKSAVEKFGVEKSGVEMFTQSLGLKLGLKSPGLKGMGLKLGVEKSGVEMSFNPNTQASMTSSSTLVFQIEDCSK